MNDQAAQDVALMRKVAVWHARLMTVAMAWRKEHPGFTFAVRKRDNPARYRMEAGYWFQGSETYLFFAPFGLSDTHNKTRTIGLVFGLKDGELNSAYVEIVYGSIQDPALRRVHERLLEALGMGVTQKKKRTLDLQPVTIEGAFDRFMADVYPKARRIIEEEEQQDRFFIGEDEFESTLQRFRLKYASAAPPSPAVAAVGTQDRASNIIYYGPPGTGKTRQYQLLRQDPRYRTEAPQLSKDALEEQRVASATWLAVIAAALMDLGGSARVPELREHRWVRATARSRGRSQNIAQTLWGTLQQHAPRESETVRTATRSGAAVFDKDDASVWRLLPNWRDADPELADAVDAIVGAGTKPQGGAESRLTLVTFHPSYAYEDFVEGIRPVPVEGAEDGRVEFRVQSGVFKELCEVAHLHPAQRYALFIDEINRANLAKVLGELITLIEPDKRVAAGSTPGDAGGQGLWVTLPTSKERFGVPDNLDIYATMNTADRSIALMDVALRRRFRFEETPPVPEQIQGADGNGAIVADGVSIDLPRLLRTINSRIEYLLDRDRCIGHAYLLDVRTLDDLRHCFRDRVVPLLQEYFFDDWGRIRHVLCRMGKPDHSSFVTVSQELPSATFGQHLPDFPSAPRYRIDLAGAMQSWTADDFRFIYTSPGATDSDDDDDEAAEAAGV